MIAHTIKLDTPYGNLGRYQSFMSGEHGIPPGSEARELKTCENCARLFTRDPATCSPVTIKEGAVRVVSHYGVVIEINYDKGVVMKDAGQRHCPACRANMLQPPTERQQADYREQLPLAARVGYRLPRYDNAPRPPRLTREPRKKVYLTRPWKERLRAAFAERGPLTYQQIAEVTGHSVGKVHGLIRTPLSAAGIGLVKVGCVWPRDKGHVRHSYLPEPGSSFSS